MLDRNWRCDAGEIDLVLRDGRVLVVCEVKTRASTAYGSPLEAVTERQGGPAAAARRPVAGRAPAAPRRGAHRPGRRAGRRAAARRGSTTCAGSADGVRHRADRSRSRVRAVTWSTSRSTWRTASSATALVGRPDASINEARDRCRAAVANSGFELAEHPAGHDPALARRPAQARTALRPGHRGGGAGRGRRGAAARARRGRVRRRADPRRPAAGGAGGAADGAGRRGPGGSSAWWCRSRRPRRRRWSRGWPWSACGRCVRWWPTCAGTRSPRRRRSTPMSERVAAQLARRAADRPRSTSRTSHGHGRRPVRRRGRRRRRPPPDARAGRREPARPRWPSGSPACCPTSRPRSRWSSPRSTRWRAACRRATAMITRPPFRAPHHYGLARPACWAAAPAGSARAR